MNRSVIKGVAATGFAVCLFGLTGCSTLNRVAGILKFWERDRTSAEDRTRASFMTKARPVRQGNPESHYNLARYYQERGKHREAIEEFEKAVAIDPTNLKALNALGVSHDKIGEFDYAAECYREALRIDPTAAYLHNNLGQSYLLKGDYRSASDAFRRALALDNANPRIQNNLNKAYAMAGERDLLREPDQNIPTASAKQSVEESMRETALSVHDEDLLNKTLRSVYSTSLDDEAKAFVRRVSLFLDDKSRGMPRDEKIEEAPALMRHDANLFRQSPIEISNGNGVNGMARNLADYLRRRGFLVTRVTNAKNFQMPETCVYYTRSHKDTADELAKEMSEVRTVKEVVGFDVPRVKVKVVLGKDIASQQTSFIE